MIQIDPPNDIAQFSWWIECVTYNLTDQSNINSLMISPTVMSDILLYNY